MAIIPFKLWFCDLYNDTLEFLNCVNITDEFRFEYLLETFLEVWKTFYKFPEFSWRLKKFLKVWKTVYNFSKMYQYYKY